MTAAKAPAVAMRGIRKRFGDVEVLRGVDLEVQRGEVHALLGGNGAGKSTLMKILRGVHRADAGEIFVDGRLVQLHRPSDASAAGIAMVFQEFSLIPTLTVAQNVFLGREPRRRGLIDESTQHRHTRELLERMQVDIDPRAVVADLPVGQWQLTEIAKALALDARVVVLDEPTASLAYAEVEQLFSLVRRLRADGLGVIYISHRMAEIAQVADRMSVLRDGWTVLCDSVDALPPRRVAEAIVGREIVHGLRRDRAESDPGPPVLQVRGMCSGSRVLDVSFDVAAGEVVGLAGLIGSGRTELVRCLTGVDRLTAGEMTLDGRPFRPRHPGHAVRAGVMHVPEDRRQQGLVLQHSVAANTVLPACSRLRWGPFFDERRGRGLCAGLIDRLRIHGATPEIEVSRLSGGNQQKVVLGKWLALAETGVRPRVLVLDEPTTGVDIASKTDIMQLVLDLADAGTAIVVVSSELAELLAVSDRVLVMRGGRVHTSLERSAVEDEESLQLAIQGARS